MINIAIIYTTFLRDALFQQTIQSILGLREEKQISFVLLIGDQNLRGPQLSQQLLYKNYIRVNITHFFLPFDCGVSFARNYLMQYASHLGISYCLLTADSIAFTTETINRLPAAIQFLQNHPKAGILGFDLKDRVPWEYNMDIRNNSFFISKPGPLQTDPLTGLRFNYCDICRQFFLAKTDTLLSVKWDEQLKIGEHEDFFWRYKLAGHKVCWTPDITGQYIDYKPAEYVKYRNRQYTEFRQILFNKYRLNNWVEYAQEPE